MKKNHFSIMEFRLLLFMIFVSQIMTAQQTLTEEQAVERALAFHPAVAEAQFSVEAGRQLQRSAFSLPNPAVGIQNPTGAFYAVGINQNFDFPTVYHRQRKMLEASTRRDEGELNITKHQLIWQTRSVYYEARYSETKKQMLLVQDSIYGEILSNAKRQLDAGEISALEWSYTSLRANSIQQEYRVSVAEAAAARQALLQFCGLDSSFIISPWTKEEIATLMKIPETGTGSNLFTELAKRERELAQSDVKLEKSRALPGIQLGYLNQAERQSAVSARWQAGITIPLWFWQYTARAKAAEQRLNAAAEKEKSVALENTIAVQSALLRVQALQAKMNFFLREGWKQIQELTEVSTRFFNAGESDYQEHLRTISDALQAQLDFYETAKQLADAQALLSYLNAQ